MFTGIIEEIGTVKSIEFNGRIAEAVIYGNLVIKNSKMGDSIAVNGVCQTITKIKENLFSVEISSTTLKKTTLPKLKKNHFVNLERAIKADDRFGGHFVQGHVNGTGKIETLIKNDSMIILKVCTAAEFIRLTIDEGSIAIDGVSLTVFERDIKNNAIFIRIIPHTYKSTILQYKNTGDEVNIETDMIGRYLDSLMRNKQESKITLDNIQKMGF